MSFRTAARVVARQRAMPAARAVVPRRFASSSDPSSHKAGGSSNATWAMGSAVVFGGLAAFIMMPSAEKEHVAHQHHPHEPKEPGPVQHTSQELQDNIDNAPVESLAKKSGGDFNYKEVDEAKKEGREIKDPPKAVAQGDKKAPGEDENADGKDDGSSKAASSDDSSSSSEGYEPSKEEIASSIKRGERTDAPPVAESEEEKGVDVQAKKD